MEKQWEKQFIEIIIQCKSSISNRKDCNMLEVVGKFLDSLYETSKSCNEFDVYQFQKEWYENNGYTVIFENGHHEVLHKEN